MYLLVRNLFHFYSLKAVSRAGYRVTNAGLKSEYWTEIYFSVIF